MLFLGHFLIFVLFFVNIDEIICEDSDEKNSLRFEYHHYLTQVANLLESDPKFKEKLDSLKNDSDIIGVADHLDLVSHKVRTQLDELKRLEIDRLNKLEFKIERKAENIGKKVEGKVDRDHIDLQSSNGFQKEDLRKLIKKSVDKFDELDKKAEEEYRIYKMEKEINRRAALSKIKSKELRERQRMIEEEKRNRLKEHKPLNYPGTEEQFKEVWEKDDHLERDTFEPITFFRLHDTNADGHLDVAEIESILQKELSKMYNTTNSTENLVELYNEMRLMRKQIFKDIDLNNDMMISFTEFMSHINSPEYKKKTEWKTQDDNDTKPYSNEELERYQKQYQKNHPSVNIELFKNYKIKKWTLYPKKKNRTQKSRMDKIWPL